MENYMKDFMNFHEFSEISGTFWFDGKNSLNLNFMK
jgi:hypothetical protein